MVLGSKEDLMQQLTQTWDILLQVDAKLEDTIDFLQGFRKNIRNLKQEPNDKTTVRGTARMGASTGMGTRPTA
jgi:hypothetical protein